MKTPWKTALLAGILCQTAIHAQIAPPLTVSSSGTNPVDFEFRADGTLISKGNFGVGSLLSTDQGAGTRMLWYPAKGAFRAGEVPPYGSSWDDSNIGPYSVAFGRGNQASGSSSAALGSAVLASGDCSVAMGVDSGATGGLSLAMGYSTYAVGLYSLAFGYYASASGWSSTAVGPATSATGDGATAMGMATKANAYSSMAVGRFNVGGGNPTQWISTDPLFEVGNGASWDSESNALTVYKNGNVTVQGVITAAPGGDIPMFSGN